VKRPLVPANDLDAFFRVAFFPVACHGESPVPHRNKWATFGKREKRRVTSGLIQ
jgi:hypothetical protein